MNKQARLTFVVVMGLMLSSCAFEEQGNTFVSGSLSFSTESVDSRKGSSEIVLPPVSPKSSKESSSLSSASSSKTITYRVSIYQSYLIESKGTYGNPRFDFSVDIEAGKPLFSDTRELRELKRMCNEVYEPSGGAYTIDGFFTDETCRIYFTTDRLIEENVNAYYFCHG